MPDVEADVAAFLYTDTTGALSAPKAVSSGCRLQSPNVGPYDDTVLSSMGCTRTPNVISMACPYKESRGRADGSGRPIISQWSTYLGDLEWAQSLFS